MKKFFGTLSFILAYSCSVYCDYYNQLFMRDIAIFFENSEHAYNNLTPNSIKTGLFYIAITDMVSELLYNEASPIIATKAILEHLFELADIAEKLLETDTIKYQQNIQSFKDSRYANTILQDDNIVKELSNILRHMRSNYALLQAQTFMQLNSKPLEEIQKDISNWGSSTIFNVPTASNSAILLLAKDIFKYFLIVEKIKTLNMEFLSIDNFLALVIPNGYLNKTKANMKEYLKDNNIVGSDELIVGLKYKSLKKIPNPFDPKSYFPNQWLSTRSPIFDLLEVQNYTQKNLPQILNTLFFTQKEIASVISRKLKKIYKNYFWNIYIAGHGSNPSESSMIASIPDEDLIKLLNYFNSQIKTNIAFIVSCFGSGERLRLFNIPNLKYILVLGSTTKSTTFRVIQNKLKFEHNKIEFEYRTNIDQFFKSLRQGSGKSYFDLFNNIQTFWRFNKKKNKKFYAQNIPQIKLPNAEWFQITDLQKNELNLNRLLISLHNYNKKPIIINNKRLLFLNQQSKYEQHKELSANKMPISLKTKKQNIDINFPLIFQGTKIPIVIPMEPSAGKYNFESIEAPDSGLTYLTLKFMGLSSQMYNRAFNIKSLTIRNPSFKGNPYAGLFKDNILFNLKMAQLKLNPLPIDQSTIMLTNVTIKARTTGPKPIYRLKFEYEGNKFVIEKPKYKKIAKILEKPKSTDLIPSTKKLLNNTKKSAIKPSSKYQWKSPEPNKGFQEIERALIKKQKERKINENRISLQILSQTLNMLSYQL